MKKLFALLAVVLAVVSCQKDADLDVNVDGEQLVNITVALPEATRATSGVGALENGVLANYDLRYILEIYRVEGTEIKYDSCQRFVKPTDETTVVFPVRLVAGEGRNYKIVAWADIVETGSEDDRYYYTQEGLNNVVLMDNGTVNWNAMDETRDAYTAEKLINNFNSASDLNLTLTRPFAKVRVIATDIVDVLEVGIVPTTAEMEYIDNMPYKYNAVADNGGYAFNEVADKTHSYAYATTATKYTDQPGEYTLFTDYVFVPQSGTAKFSLEVFDAQGRSIKNNAFNTEIFVERNKVTTIKGDVLTTGGNVIVKVEDEFAGDIEIKVVDTPEALVEQFESLNDDNVEEVNIEFGGDINLNDLLTAGILSTRAGEAYGLKVPAGKTVVLDLNGYTLSQEKECSAHYSMIDNYGNLTITGNGTISFKDTGAGDPNFGWGSYTISNRAGTLVVENGTIEHIGEQNQGNGTPNCHMYCAIWQYDGSTIINGGKISTPTYRSARLWQGDMTINGGEFDGQLWLQAINNNANLTINGGTFSPNGNDGSSVFVSNIDTSGVKHNVAVSVTGGHFTTKIGMSEPFACITGGTFTAEAKEGTNTALINDDYAWTEAENGNWTLTRKPNVAMIGEVGYTSLAKAVAAVEDGGTITLVADVTFDELSRQNSGGTWYEGLYYIGNKNFTIDLGGKTISQNGAVNDYLFLFKNDTDKANTINFINGTLNAGTSAYCALCTSTTSTAKITINLENVNLVGNNSNGAVAKIRGGAEFNVKAGTVITGADSYVGIESYGATVNIYEGAEIYQNGTSSYNGCLIGVSGNGVINVYGGKGKGAQGGFIAMTSGGTINVSGGEWIANTDGAYANSNKSVLIAQSASGAKSIVNVTGGTFKGGYNCYGDAIGDAQINIKGGNFNADPASYVVAGYESVEENGIYTVAKPKALVDFEAAIAKGGNVTLASDVTLLETIVIENEVVIDLNGKTITGTMHKNVGHVIVNNGTLTLKNGTVTSAAANGGSAVRNNGTMTIENVTVNGAPREGESWPAYPINNYGNMTIKDSTVNGYQGVLACNTAGNTTVDNCTFTKNYCKTSSHVFYINDKDANVVVNSGTFAHNGFDGSLAYVNKGTITINGGTFTTKDGGYGIAVLTNGKAIINGGDCNYINWGGTIEDNRNK